MATDRLTKPHPDTIVMRPTHGLAALNLRDLWVYRELIVFLSWRDVLVRYKQTVLGFAWAVIQPIIQMIVFTLIFSKAAGLSSEGVPYPIFNYTALLPWGLFSKAMNDAGRSLVNNRNMITKIYFPRLIMPLSGILSPLVDFAVSFSILLLLMVYYGFAPTWNVVFLPLFILLALATSLSVGLWLSALNVKYRDFQYTVPFIIQAWLYASPVVYSANILPESVHSLYGLNPMAGVIQGFRWALLGTEVPDGMIFASVIVVAAILISGIFYFRRMEQYYADIV